MNLNNTNHFSQQGQMGFSQLVSLAVREVQNKIGINITYSIHSSPSSEGQILLKLQAPSGFQSTAYFSFKGTLDQEKLNQGITALKENLNRVGITTIEASNNQPHPNQ